MKQPQQARAVQWHLAADGSAIKAYPKALDHFDPKQEAPKGLKYQRYATTRRVALADLYAFEEAVDKTVARDGSVSSAAVLTGVIGLAAMIVGWVVLPAIGVDGGWTQILRIAAIPVLVAGVAGVMFTPSLTYRRIEGLRAEAGLDVSTLEVLKEPDALALLHAPGTVSGPGIAGG
ncbi:hypothetical protein [Glycomyces harbinensis]|uniref:Uncharacterized protein n=1 Tax=Glycomyces harbinensis TaxID=58114 RepID=A0A1G6V3P9_9ACTN|nr:hypothetical protein [Glycomyces harbinensis]SDD47607.1 hypothetical protein SAMN05216270_104165 [Glycomyces harbinensis]